MRKLPLTRLCWLALRASAALMLTVAPYHLTFDGVAKLVPAAAHAESEGGDGGDGGHSGEGGDGDGGGDGDHSGEGHDGDGGDDGGHDGEGHDAGDDDGAEHDVGDDNGVDIDDDANDDDTPLVVTP
jgi:hypothetical protein